MDGGLKECSGMEADLLGAETCLHMETRRRRQALGVARGETSWRRDDGDGPRLENGGRNRCTACPTGVST